MEKQRNGFGSYRHLPRFFLNTLLPSGERANELAVGSSFAIPEEEYRKLTRVLRLGSDDYFAVLPNDSRLLVCEIKGRNAKVVEEAWPDTEPIHPIWVAQSLSKGDKLENIVRFCTQLGAAGFIIFESDRSVMKWDESKRVSRMTRLKIISREEAEVSFRVNLPEFKWLDCLDQVIDDDKDFIALSELETEQKHLQNKCCPKTIIVGPEGGWSQRELDLIGENGVSLGPRVLRVEYAAAAALSKLLLP